MNTYDFYFNDSENSNNKGFNMNLEETKEYTRIYNGTNESYFADYKGGTVSIVCNENGEEVYNTTIK
jgi:hypothetical protein